MTGATEAPRSRVGVVGEWFSAIAQLLEEAPAWTGARFFQIADPARDGFSMDELCILSQEVALAHLPALIKCKKPCTIILHRNRGKNDMSTWRSGLLWLGKSLSLSGWDAVRLVALTEEAAKAAQDLVGRPVATLDPPGEIDAERPTVSVSRGSEEITFTFDLPGEDRETRRARLDNFNWIRLRRLARLRASDSTDAAMMDLVAFANGAAREAAVSPGQVHDHRPPCLISVVPNGVGLGHVTRMMAIASALKRDLGMRVVFWSFSRAAEILQAAGFEVILRQNAFHLGAHPPDWRAWETHEFANAIRELGATLVSNDGVSFDAFLIDALRSPGCGRCGVVWVRRGMLSADTDAGILEAEQFCDLVIEPGDLAVAVDKGPTRTRRARNRGFSQHIMAQPVTLKPFLPSYTARASRRRLGLGWGRHCLVSLGGAFGDSELFRQQLVRSARRHRVKLVWARSPLAGPEMGEGSDVTRQFYPLNRYLDAFDGMVTAAGYNSFHELMLGYDKPVLFAPTNFLRLDDQVARAGYAGQEGWASVIYADQPDRHAEIIDEFFRQVLKRAPMARPSALPTGEEISQAIAGLVTRYRTEEHRT